MELHDLKAHVDKRFDEVQAELKLLTRHDADITWLKGAVRWGATLIMAAITTIIGMLMRAKN